MGTTNNFRVSKGIDTLTVSNISGINVTDDVAVSNTNISFSSATGLKIMNKANSPLVIGTNNTAAITINPNGSVVIAGGIPWSNLTSKPTTLSGYGITDGVSSSLLGSNSGIATLDSSGKITSSQLPSYITGAMAYQGTWNASTNTPTLTSGSGIKGLYYKVSVAGNTNIDGLSNWQVGDIIVFNGTTWDGIDGKASEVLSVAGRTGTVTLSVSDVLGAAPLESPTFTGTITGNGSGLTNLNASNLGSGTVPAARLATGTASSTTYLRGDGTWQPTFTGATITNDTTTNSTFYPLFSSTTNGISTVVDTASTKLTFNPSTGTLFSTVLSTEGLTSSGNIDIGTSSALVTAGRGVNRRYLTIIGNGDQGSIQLASSVAGSGNNGNIEWYDIGNSSSTSYRNAFIYSGTEGTTTNNKGSFLSFATKQDGVSGGGTVRMSIDNTGLVSVSNNLSLNNGTSNLISFGNGGGAPTFTSRSSGTKLLLSSYLDATHADYAIGTMASNMWLGVPTTSEAFRFYGGQTLAATLTGSGNFTTAGDIRAYRSSAPTTGVYYFSQSNDKYLYFDGTNFSLVGANLFSVGATTSIDAKSFNSVVAQGTSPITVTSTTMCTNLNANYLGGYAASATSGVASRAVCSDSNGYISNTYFNMSANLVGDTAIDKVVIATGDNFLRWQTPTHFTRRLNLGRVVNYATMAQNGRLYPGPLWSFYYPQGYNTWYLPTIANTALGDTIEIVSMHWSNNGGWSSTYTLTLACDSNVRIGTQAFGESFILDDSRVQRITLTCNWVDGSNAAWSLS